MKPSLRTSVLIVSSDQSPLGIPARLHERYKVERVDSGKHALEAIEGKQYDVLLISAQLSDMAGADLASSLASESESRPGTILIHEHVMALNEALATLNLPKSIEQLNRPIGEFTLMKAIDEAAARLH